MGYRSLRSFPPTKTLELESGLSLVPRLKLLLSVFRSDPSVKPIDEWQLKRALIDFLKDSLSIHLSVSEDDLELKRCKDLKKRKREDPVASGTLYIRDPGALSQNKKEKENDRERNDEDIVEMKFFEWRGKVLERLNGLELNTGGVKFYLKAELPDSDDFDKLKKSWEEEYRGNYSRGSRRRPDTILVKGVPSRWFSEPRVSSKPSMLVTHTIFSVFGKIRNLNVAGEDTPKEADDSRIFPGLQCKIWVQFEKHEDFYNALKVLCGRWLQKQGSPLTVDYEVTWERDGFFKSSEQNAPRNQIQENNTQRKSLVERLEAPRFQSQNTRFTSDGARVRRFKIQYAALRQVRTFASSNSIETGITDNWDKSLEQESAGG